MILLIALLVCPLAGCASSSDSVEPAKIILMSDLHYLSPSLYEGSSYFTKMMSRADGKMTEYSDEILDAWIEEVKAQNPDAVILAGDLTFNGEKVSHEELSAKLQDLTDTGIPVLVIPGNHDIDNPSAAKYREDVYVLTSSVDTDTFHTIYQNCGYSQASLYDEISGSYVYEVNDTCWILMIDINGKEKSLSESTLSFIRSVLQKAKKEKATVIGVSHQNLLAHNELFRTGFQMDNADQLLELYEKYNVTLHLSGHMHIQHIATEKTVTEIVQSSLSVGPFSYGILDINEESIRYRTTALDTGAWDSVRYFKDTAYGKTYDSLIDQGIDPAQAEEMSSFFADVNYAYFSGTMDTVDQTWFEEGLAVWKNSDSSTWMYLKTMEKELGKNMNEFSR